MKKVERYIKTFRYQIEKSKATKKDVTERKEEAVTNKEAQIDTKVET